jgi:hypothetical protein
LVEVNKDEGGTCRELEAVRQIFIRSWNGRRNEASCVDAELKKKKKLEEGIAKHDTSTSEYYIEYLLYLKTQSSFF